MITIRNTFIKFILAIVVFSSIVIGFLFFLKQGYSQQVAIIKNIHSNDYKTFESEFKVKFPLDTEIKSVTVLNGKDSWLRVDLLVPTAKVKEFDSSISFDYPDSPRKNDKQPKHRIHFVLVLSSCFGDYSHLQNSY